MLTASQIKSNITTLRDAGRTIVSLTHECASSVVGHALAHGDVTLADGLLAAVGNGARKSAIVKFLETFGPFRYDTKKGTFGIQKGKKLEMLAEHSANWWADNLTTLNPEIVDDNGAAVARWDEYTPEKIRSMYDVDAQILSIIKSAKKRMESGEPVAHSQRVAQLEKMLMVA